MKKSRTDCHCFFIMISIPTVFLIFPWDIHSYTHLISMHNQRLLPAWLTKDRWSSTPESNVGVTTCHCQTWRASCQSSQARPMSFKQQGRGTSWACLQRRRRSCPWRGRSSSACSTPASGWTRRPSPTRALARRRAGGRGSARISPATSTKHIFVFSCQLSC